MVVPDDASRIAAEMTRDAQPVRVRRNETRGTDVVSVLRLSIFGGLPKLALTSRG
jgi:hypothetical protein